MNELRNRGVEDILIAVVDGLKGFPEAIIAITEGFHRKMKLIQRRAYGFKNFSNYRLRVIAQCG